MQLEHNSEIENKFLIYESDNDIKVAVILKENVCKSTSYLVS